MTGLASSTPPAEVDIDVDLIRDLLVHQHPDLAELSLSIQECGWDNVMVRLGEDLALRLPRRAAANPLVLKEQRWLHQIAPRLPLPIPVPVRTGVPQQNYPFHWSVLPWLPGSAADLAQPAPSEAAALAGFLQALHMPAPDDAPKNPSRDCPLSDKREDIEARMADLAKQGRPLPSVVIDLWNEALSTAVDLPTTWISGDLHARNILVHEGKLSAFIDWGDMCTGDPATDLASAWALFDDHEARTNVLNAYGASQATISRAKGWAIFFGVLLLHTGLNDTPRHAAMGEAVLRRLAQTA